MKGEANACLKHGDTLARQGSLEGYGSRLHVQTFVQAINCRDVCRDDYMGVRTGVRTGDCRTFLVY